VDPPSTRADGENPARWRILLVLCVVQFMLFLDETIVNVALPSIKDALGFSQNGLTWVVNAYVLTFGGFLLLGGRLSDLVGRLRVFLSGVALFGVASLVCGLAQGEGMLIAARAAQGLGAAFAGPSALAIVAGTFTDGAERARALGIWSALAGLGAAAGVVLSGTITELISWRWIFFINIPIALVALVLIPRLVEERRHPAAGTPDVLGAVTITAGLTALVYTLLTTDQRGWGDPVTIAGFVVSAGLIAAFVAVESRVERPLVRLGFFRHRRMAAADGLQVLAAAVLFCGFFLLTLYMQQVLGFSPLEAGLAWLGFFVGLFPAFAVATTLVIRRGVRPVLVAGMLVIAAGFLVLSRIGVDSGYAADLLPGMVLFGFGIGFVYVANAIAAISEADESEAGLASGLVATAQQVGGAVGLATLVVIATTHASNLVASGATPALAQVDGTQLAFQVTAGVAIAAAVIAAVLIGHLRPASVPTAAIPLTEDAVAVVAGDEHGRGAPAAVPPRA
jgi:EmrB/QacA subfamily drug resistance transporter